jgi:hypothetical protein
MKTTITFLIILTGWQGALAQTLALPKFLRKMYMNNDSSRKKSFVVLPVLGSAPETGIEIGAATLLSFYTDTVDRKTRVSNLFAYTSFTTKGQERFSVSTTYWTPQNKHYYNAGVSYQSFPFSFYGVGNDTRVADADHINEKRFKVNFTSQQLLGSNIYAGYVLGGFKYLYNDKNFTGIFSTSTRVEDKNGGASVFAGPIFVYDTRDNNTYTTKGLVITSYFNIMHGVLDNNSYAGGFFNIEYAQFFSFNRQLVLGINIKEQSLSGSRSPFYLLPQLGNDAIMRGYYNGRYRDRNLLAGQTELRYRISPRFGIAGFVGTGEVFRSEFSFSGLKPDYGAGVRYFFDVDKGLSIRLDYAVGQKSGGEPRQTGFYIALGQSF